MGDTGQVSASLGLSLGLSLQPVCALRGLVFYKVVFELGGSSRQWCIMATRGQAISSAQKFVG